MKRYWRKPKKYAGAWNGTLSGLFYRESKQKSDFEGEKKFEAAAAGAGEFSCTMGYDSTNNLFYTQYVFDITEHIEEE